MRGVAGTEGIGGDVGQFRQVLDTVLHAAVEDDGTDRYTGFLDTVVQLFGFDGSAAKHIVGDGGSCNFGGGGVVTVFIRFPAAGVTGKNEYIVLCRSVFCHVFQYRGYIIRFVHRSIFVIHNPLIGQREQLHLFLVGEIDTFRSYLIEIHLIGFTSRRIHFAGLLEGVLALLVKTFLRGVFHIYEHPDGEVVFFRLDVFGCF